MVHDLINKSKFEQEKKLFRYTILHYIQFIHAIEMYMQRLKQ